jgi:hypothetical protein
VNKDTYILYSSKQTYTPAVPGKRFLYLLYRKMGRSLSYCKHGGNEKSPHVHAGENHVVHKKYDFRKHIN